MVSKLSLKLKLFLCFVIILSTSLVASSQVREDLDSLFNAINKNKSINGTVLVAENGKPIFEKAFGYSNFENGELLTTKSIFELASVSKQFTAMSIMQLKQKGRLAYNDDVKKYITNFPYENVTISNLLHHTSGIQDFLGWGKSQIDTSRINYNKDVLASLISSNHALRFNPGEIFSYSNTNYVILALIVEKLSGVSFAEYLNKNIFTPLNMSNTRVYAQRIQKTKINNFAQGHIYDPQKDKFVVNDSIATNNYQYFFDGVAGPFGISSTVEDLLKWDQALYTEKLVSFSTQKDAYLASKLNNGENASLMGMNYGFGWLILPDNEFFGKRYMHSGGYPGYMSIITRYPDKNKTIIILTNTWNVINLYQLNTAIENILFGKPFSIPKPLPFKKSIILNPSQLKAIEGVYTLIGTTKITISTENNQAFAQLTGQIKAPIYAESELDFFYTIVPAKIKFEKNKSGRIGNLVLLQSG